MWQLTINVNKTKILIVHKRATQPFKWVDYGKKIEIVENFCYLSFELNSKDTFVAVIERLCSKTRIACMSIREQFNL